MSCKKCAMTCAKCQRTFIEDGKLLDSQARYPGTPFCRSCMDNCQDSEIADHVCTIDRWYEAGRPLQWGPV